MSGDSFYPRYARTSLLPAVSLSLWLLTIHSWVQNPLCPSCVGFVLFCFYFLPVWFWQAVRSFYSGFCAHIISSVTCWFLWVTLSPSFENNLPSLQMYWPFRKTTAALIHSCLCFSLGVSLSEIHPNNVPWEPVSVPGTDWVKGLRVWWWADMLLLSWSLETRREDGSLLCNHTHECGSNNGGNYSQEKKTQLMKTERETCPR